MIVLPASDDRSHNLNQPGSYEWSYFDGLSADAEWGFVAIWFRGCPMSPYYTAAIDRSLARPGSPPPDPGDYTAFNFNLYHRGRRVYYVLREGPAAQFSADTAGPDIRSGANAVRCGNAPDGGQRFIIYLDTRLSSGLGHVVGDIDIAAPVSPVFGAQPSAYDGTGGGDFWVPAAPDGRFTARLDLWRPMRGVRKLRFNGRAYHDRNFGDRPLHHLHADWHWGRLHCEQGAFVYFSVAPDDPTQEPFQQLMLLDGGRAPTLASRFDIAEAARRRHWSTLAYAPAISGSTPGGALRFSVEERGRLDSGPFYHRHLSHIRVESERGIMEGTGITEFLRPARLGVAAFRPFIKFRVNRS